ncbi:unnamed protein product [Psylliodes chrysocephalus]|uniref:Fatty acyl-CoA reductase n=1 Tax=Psylliodes chrysocephalus TaxID=3402493 RepID=A0A9P0D182_9CUCU|nr:unnamed protein product [Psylliodes chrysocephala]
METSEIAEWYRNQHVFVTGATGFMGKILIEKILRSCPDVAAVYILIRPKKGKEAAQRLEDFFSCPIFENLKKSATGKDSLQKLKCIDGDITKEHCGISDENIAFLQNTITSVFHMAANVRFDQPVKSAVLLNTGGTLNVLELACKLENLKVFMHVSTSYCHCDVTELEEKIYKAPQDPRKILDLVRWMDDDLLETLTPTLLKDSPNSYAYTKCLTEQLVSEYSDKLPIAITRPSIVTAVAKDPIPGWVDNLNGATGIIIAAGKGILRSMHCDISLCADYVPVDMAINSILTVAWKVGSEVKKSEPEVYHLTANRDNAVSWGEALEISKKHVFDYPFSVCLWYPGGSPKSTYLMHAIAAFFFHVIPAYVVDFLLQLTGNKTFMVNLQKRLDHGLKVLQYYTTRPWFFHNDKFANLFDTLNERDKEIFYSNRKPINHNEYFLNYVLGARKYCVKEEIDTVPHARKVMRRLYFLDLLKDIILYGIILWLFYLFVLKFFEIIGTPLN